jgi:hypothetical protein
MQVSCDPKYVPFFIIQQVGHIPLLHDLDGRLPLLRRRSDLLREQKEDRARLAKIVRAQLTHWERLRLTSQSQGVERNHFARADGMQGVCGILGLGMLRLR